MAALGLIFGLLLIVKLGREQGLNPDKLWNLGLIAIISGIVGAKLLMFVTEPEYLRHPADIFSLATLQAAGVWSGGFLLALVMCVWYMKANNMPVLRTCDVFAPGLALGHAFGRVGCFLNGCCYGKACSLPWAVRFPVPHPMAGIPVHPTEIYEALGNAFIFFGLMFLYRKKRFDGQIWWGYVLSYGMLRFAVEFFRGDYARYYFGILTIGHFIAAAMILIALAALVTFRSRMKKSVRAPAVR